MNILQQVFTKDKLKLVAGLVKKAGQIFLGKLADALWDSAKRNVAVAQAAGGEGSEKFERAYKGIVKDVGDLEGAARFWAKIFIECLVMILKEDKVKFFKIS